MAGINLAGSGQALVNSLNTIMSEFKLLTQAEAVMEGCATHYTLAPHTGRSKNVLNYGRLRAYTLEDGVDMAQAQSLTDESTAYTPVEIGVQVVIANSTLRRVADADLLRNIGRMMANAYTRESDTNGCLQLSSFTPSVGSAGTVASPGHMLAISSRLAIGNNRTDPEPAPKPWHFVHHPLALAVVAGRLMPLSSTPGGAAAFGANTGAHAGVTVTGPLTGVSGEIARRSVGGIGMLFQMMVKSDANIPVDSSDDAIGAGFSQEGLIFIRELAPKLWPQENDISLRGLELNLIGSEAWGTYRPDAYGVDFTADASLPTS